ncbi:MAG: T9SS type A sorting domain-containing protein [Candidatus Marinimicrobia bacterium]|nr:T9SS type A sorting domain-containing protein [Candidatus Neomarinimicrobiota bacterium]
MRYLVFVITLFFLFTFNMTDLLAFHAVQHSSVNSQTTTIKKIQTHPDDIIYDHSQPDRTIDSLSFLLRRAKQLSDENEVKRLDTEIRKRWNSQRSANPVTYPNMLIRTNRNQDGTEPFEIQPGNEGSLSPHDNIEPGFNPLREYECNFPTDYLVDGNTDDQKGVAVTVGYNGVMYLAYEDFSFSPTRIKIKKSTDNGNSWTSIVTVSSSGNVLLPDMVEYNGMIYMAYYDEDDAAVWCYRKDVPTGNYSFDQISYETQNPHRPRITCDANVTAPVWLYIIYEETDVLSGGDLHFAKCTNPLATDDDFGFDNPVDISSIGEDVQPDLDIAVGHDGNMYVAYKVDDWFGKIRMRISNNWGSSFSDPIALTTSNNYAWLRIAASKSDGSVLLTYTYKYSDSDWDVRSKYSTNHGSSWSGSSIASSGEMEYLSDCATDFYTSNNDFYCSWYHEGTIEYARSENGSNNWGSVCSVSDNDDGSDDDFSAVYVASVDGEEAGLVAWVSDYSSSNYNIYFNLNNPSAPPAPDPPTTIYASAGDNPGQIDLSWSTVSDADGYILLYDDDSSFPPWDPVSGTPSPGYTTPSTSVTITGLEGGQQYWLTVRAYNDNGYSNYADIVTATPIGNVEIIALTDGTPYSGYVNADQYLLFSINVPNEAKALEVWTYNTSGDVLDMYLGHGYYPSTGEYDAVSGGYSGNEEIGIYLNSSPSLQSGDYYILVYGYIGGNFTIRAKYQTNHYFYELYYDTGTPTTFHNGFMQNEGPAVLFNGFHDLNGNWIPLSAFGDQTLIFWKVKAQFYTAGQFQLEVHEFNEASPSQPGTLVEAISAQIDEDEISAGSWYWKGFPIGIIYGNFSEVKPFWVFAKLLNATDPQILSDTPGDGGHSYGYANSSWSGPLDFDWHIRTIIATFEPMLVSIEKSVAPIDEFRLSSNYPNPFNPQTTINYDLPRPERITLSIFDIEGRLITVLLDNNMPAGSHMIIWDGTNDSGYQLSTGVYFCQMKAGFEVQTIKMLLTK